MMNIQREKNFPILRKNTEEALSLWGVPPSHLPFHRTLTHAEVLGQSSSSSRGGNLATPRLTAKSMVTFRFLQQVQVTHLKERLTCGNCCFPFRVSWHVPLNRRAWILNRFRIRTDSVFLQNNATHLHSDLLFKEKSQLKEAMIYLSYAAVCSH